MSRTTNKNKLQVLRADNEASANDGKHIRNILIFAGIFVLMLGVGMLRAGAEMHSGAAEPTPDPNWSALIASMDKMHMAMTAVARSGDSDVDFVRLMQARFRLTCSTPGIQLKRFVAAFTRNARRNLFADMSAAIDDWEADLVYLKRTYYDRKYDFRWPPTHDNVV